MFLELNKWWQFQKLINILNVPGKMKELERLVLIQDKSVPEGMLSEKGRTTLNEDVINMLLNFEIKEVCIHLYSLFCLNAVLICFLEVVGYKVHFNSYTWQQKENKQVEQSRGQGKPSANWSLC